MISRIQEIVDIDMSDYSSLSNVSSFKLNSKNCISFEKLYVFFILINIFNTETDIFLRICSAEEISQE